jgi:hypothetical protein
MRRQTKKTKSNPGEQQKWKGELMKMTKNKLILCGLMTAALLATPGCSTQNGNQPGGGGQVRGSFGSIDRPVKTTGASASVSASDRGSGSGAQLAVNGSGNPVAPLIP